MFFNQTNKYFGDKELACKATGKIRLARGFLKRLNELREEVGIPFIVNSCCRSKEHNDSVGGHKRSLHVYDAPFHNTGGTCAIDISSAKLTEVQKYIIIGTALKHRWCVGINDKKQFIHLDTRIFNGVRDNKGQRIKKPRIFYY